jgi:succinate dehydrogenase/fumarate reductase flavoprotein subunit
MPSSDGPTVVVIGAGLAGIVACLAAREQGAEVVLLDRSGVGLTEAKGMYFVESPRPEVIPGVVMMRRLAQAVRDRPGIQRLTGFQATGIVRNRGRAVGVLGRDREGRQRLVPGGAVVLATGGAGAVYARNDNQRRALGQGFLLAARAGLPLWDMEFVQFYPVVLAQPGLPSFMIYPPYPDQARLINAAGKDLLKKFDVADLNEGIKFQRDRLSAAVFAEGQHGPVQMDLRGVPEDQWDRFPLAQLARLKFDFKHRPVTVSPGAHFFMGGVEVDHQGRTARPGLFACGEVVWGLHGANRRGGNALLECLVSGLLAGRGAAAFAQKNPPEPPPDPSGKAAPGQDDLPFQALLQEIREIAWSQAGVQRDRAGLERGLSLMDELRERIGPATGLNTSWAPDRHNLESALFTVRAVLTASLARAGSRGALQRRDYPETDNRAWRRNSRLEYDRVTGRLEVSHRPVDDP